MTTPTKKDKETVAFYQALFGQVNQQVADILKNVPESLNSIIEKDLNHCRNLLDELNKRALLDLPISNEDTHEVSKSLKLLCNSLDDTLKHFCDKNAQLKDQLNQLKSTVDTKKAIEIMHTQQRKSKF